MTAIAVRILLLVVITGCAVPGSGDVLATASRDGTEVDSAGVVEDLRFLSSAELAGRRAGTAGNAAARAYIEREMAAAGLERFGDAWTHTFALGATTADGSVRGSNVLGFVRGTDEPDRYIVVSAHYDHLGDAGGRIFHGADDNASGTAALLEIARHLVEDRPGHSVIFAAFDAEEMGLLGARSFVESPPVALGSIVLDVNLDMVGRNSAGEIYVAGTHHHPFLKDLVNEVARRSSLRVLTGHDSPDLPQGEDWTMSSDHGPFHRAGIPFAYFGVEDHPDYHQPTDTFERIEQGFFVNAVRTILDFVRTADRALVDGVLAGAADPGSVMAPSVAPAP